MKTLWLTAFLCVLGSTTWAQEESNDKLSAALQRAMKNATQRQKFALRYQYPPGQKFRWIVEDVSTTKTTAAELSEVMSSRSQSTAAWVVLSVDSMGRATLEQTLERVNMWQKNGETPPVSFDSTAGLQAPTEFESIAPRVGKPLASVLVDAQGAMVAGSDESDAYSFGTGSPWIPLPTDPVAVGDKWYVADEVATRNEDHSIKRIKLRLRYELAAVKDREARITFQTEILTPIDDPKIRSQISQRMIHGEVRFDMDRGLTTYKKVHWNDKVQGFQGPNSLFHYLREYTANFVEPNSAKTNPVAVPVSRTKPLKIRTRDDGPEFRR